MPKSMIVMPYGRPMFTFPGTGGRSRRNVTMPRSSKVTNETQSATMASGVQVGQRPSSTSGGAAVVVVVVVLLIEKSNGSHMRREKWSLSREKIGL